MSDDYLEKTVADVEAQIESLQSLVRGINRLIRERDSKLQKTTARVKPSTIEFTANDPVVIISDPVKPPETPPAEPGEPGEPVGKADKDVPPGSKPHIPPPLPEKKKRGTYKKADSKRRPMKRSRSMGTLQVGRMRASASSKGLNTKNTPPEELPEIKRICKDCQGVYPLEQFKYLGAASDSSPRERCRACHYKFYKPETEAEFLK